MTEEAGAAGEKEAGVAECFEAGAGEGENPGEILGR